MHIGNCARLKCDAPKCTEVIHVPLPTPGPENTQIFAGIYLGQLAEQGWMIPDLQADKHEHFCYRHGVGAKLDKEKTT